MTAGGQLKDSWRIAIQKTAFEDILEGQLEDRWRIARVVRK